MDRLNSILLLLSFCVASHGQSIFPGPVIANPSISTTLNNNLVAYWNLNEESGTRNASAGGMNLTDNNSVSWTGGVQSKAASFNRNLGNYLSVDNTALRGGSAGTLACWATLYSKTNGNFGIAGKYNSSGSNNREYAIIYQNTSADRWQLIISGNGTSATVLSADNAGAPVVGVRYFLVVTWTANTASISVNNGTANTTAFTVPVFAGTSPFQVGTLNNGQASSVLNGWVDEVGLWGRVLTADELTALYNAGNGVTATNFVFQYSTNSITTFTTALGTATYKQAGSRLPDQRNSFVGLGRYWMFFTTYTNTGGPIDLYYVSSTDGRKWDTGAFVTQVPLADAQFSIKYDASNNKVHFAKNTQSGGVFHDGLSYRRGTPSSDGTITWDAALQTAIATGNFVGDFSLEVGTDGKAWVGYGNASLGDAVVTKNDNTDGTWSTASGFPVAITSSTDGRFPQLAALQSGGMYASVYKWDTDVQANGYFSSGTSTFNSDSTITDNNVEATHPGGGSAGVGRIAVAGLSGVVHLVYQSSSRNIYHKSRSTGGAWSSETLLKSSADEQSSPVLGFNGSDIVVAWGDPTADLVQFIYHNGSAWSSVKTLYAEALETNFDHVMLPQTLNGNNISATWMDSVNSVKWRFQDYTQ